MIDLDEIFLNKLKIFLKQIKFILLYCIDRITPGHLKTLLYMLVFVFGKNFKKYCRNIYSIFSTVFFDIFEILSK